MMTFETFLINLLSSAHLIASPDAIKRKWLTGDEGVTSAYDYEELAQQLIEDLDIKRERLRFSQQLSTIGLDEDVANFEIALLNVDAAWSSISLQNGEPHQRHAQLLASPEWAQLRNAAQRLVSHAPH